MVKPALCGHIPVSAFIEKRAERSERKAEGNRWNMPHLILIGLDDIKQLECCTCRVVFQAFMFSEMKMVVVGYILQASSFSRYGTHHQRPFYNQSTLLTGFSSSISLLQAPSYCFAEGCFVHGTGKSFQQL